MDRFKKINVIVYNEDDTYHNKAAIIAAEFLFETLEEENILRLVKSNK